MAVGKDKTRVSVTLSKEQYEKLVKEAEKQSRSISNLASVIINEYLKDK